MKKNTRALAGFMVALAIAALAQTAGIRSAVADPIDLFQNDTTVGSDANPNDTTSGSISNPNDTTVGSTKNPNDTTVGGGKERLYLQNPLSSKYSTVGGIIDGALVILSYVAVLAAVLLLIWTGLQFVLAQGEPKKIAELKTRLYYIVIGVALVIGARIIVAVVVNTLSATQLVTPETIQSANNALNGH